MTGQSRLWQVDVFVTSTDEFHPVVGYGGPMTQAGALAKVAELLADPKVYSVEVEFEAL